MGQHAIEVKAVERHLIWRGIWWRSRLLHTIHNQRQIDERVAVRICPPCGREGDNDDQSSAEEAASVLVGDVGVHNQRPHLISESILLGRQAHINWAKSLEIIRLLYTSMFTRKSVKCQDSMLETASGV